MEYELKVEVEDDDCYLITLSKGNEVYLERRYFFKSRGGKENAKKAAYEWVREYEKTK